MLIVIGIAWFNFTLKYFEKKHEKPKKLNIGMIIIYFNNNLDVT